MIFCPACRRELPEKARFCGFCGFSLQPFSPDEHKALAETIEAIMPEGPILLTRVKQVEGRGKRQDDGQADLGGPGRPAGAEPRKERSTAGVKLVKGVWEEPPVRQLVPVALSASKAKQTATGHPTPEPPPGGGDVPPLPVAGGAAGGTAHGTQGRATRLTGPVENQRPAAAAAQAALTPKADQTARGRPATAGHQQVAPEKGPATVQAPGPAGPAQEAEPLDPKRSRRYRRFPIKVEVGYGTEHNFYTGFLENLSSGGLFVATHTPVELGDVMEVTFTVPGLGHECVTFCQVAWVRVYNPHSPDTIPGMGLKFIQLDPRVRAAIELFIKHREPIFYDED